MSIKLPNPFGRLLEKYRSVFMIDKPYNIKEAYFDNGYRHENGIKSFLGLLNITENDTCADCYIEVEYNNKTFGILWEDKGKKGKGTHYSDGIKQLKISYEILKQKGLPENFFVVLSNVKMVKGYVEAKYVEEHRCKILRKPNGDLIKCGDHPVRILDS